MSERRLARSMDPKTRKSSRLRRAVVLMVSPARTGVVLRVVLRVDLFSVTFTLHETFCRSTVSTKWEHVYITEHDGPHLKLQSLMTRCRAHLSGSRIQNLYGRISMGPKLGSPPLGRGSRAHSLADDLDDVTSAVIGLIVAAV